MPTIQRLSRRRKRRADHPGWASTHSESPLMLIKSGSYADSSTYHTSDLQVVTRAHASLARSSAAGSGLSVYWHRRTRRLLISPL